MYYWDLRKIKEFPHWSNDVLVLGMKDPRPDGKGNITPPPSMWDGQWPGRVFALNLEYLKELLIEGDAIATLPEWLGDFPNLKELRIIGNNNSPESIQTMPLLHIPPSIGHAQHLEKIELKNVHLAPFPDEFGQMKHLKECWIENCGLSTLPLAMQNLTNLEVLRLVRLPLRELPPIFSKMKHLTLLSLLQTELSEIPDMFQGCTQLQRVALMNNQLTTLPSSFKSLKSLERLNLIGNNFTEVPPVLQRLPKLQSLSIGRNHIKDVPDWLGQIRRDGSFLFELAIDELPSDNRDIEEERLRRYSPHFFRHPNPITRFPEWIGTSSLEQVTLGFVLRSLYGLPPNAMAWAALDAVYQKTHYALPSRVLQWAEVARERAGIPQSPIPEHWQPAYYDYEIGGNRRLFFEYSEIMALRDRLIAYYALSVEELAIKLVKAETLIELEQERLLHECTPSIRAYLDEHLPGDHPILLELTERAKVALANGYFLLL